MKTAGWKKCIIPAVFVLLCLLGGCGKPEEEPVLLPETPPVSQTQQPSDQKTEEETPPDKIKEMVAAMTTEEKVGQMFLAHRPAEDADQLAEEYH